LKKQIVIIEVSYALLIIIMFGVLDMKKL